MTAELFYDLLAKKLSGEATIEQLTELDALTEKHPEWINAAEMLSTLWQQSLPSENAEAQKFFERHIQRMKKAGVVIEEAFPFTAETQNKTKQRSIRWLWISVSAVAASLALFFIFKDFGSPKTSNEKELSVTEVTTPPASRTQMQLPDGSKVWLNVSSDLTYNRDFGKELREVTLSGEAFFDVVKDPAHPFIIHTKVVDVKVLGTAFNVKAYPEDKITETSLIRGSIELTVKNKAQNKFYLGPHQKLVVLNEAITEKIKSKQEQPIPSFSPQGLNYDEKDSTVIETSWVENKLIFQQKESFREVAVKMERWFGVHIIFTTESVANLVPFGSFSTETITQALDALKEGIKFNYRMNGNEIIISP